MSTRTKKLLSATIDPPSAHHVYPPGSRQARGWRFRRSQVVAIHRDYKHRQCRVVIIDAAAGVHLSAGSAITRLSAATAVRPPACPFVRPYVWPPVCPSVRQSVRSSVRPSIRPSVCPFVRPSVHTPVSLSVRPSVCPYARLSVRPLVKNQADKIICEI